MLHGILPRPNEIHHPLELMSRVWKVFGAFPIEQSEWLPYWTNGARADYAKVKISYYRYTDLAGAPQLLAFVVNISAKPVEKVTLSFPEPVCQARDMLEGRDVGLTFGLNGYSCRILFVK